MLSLRGGNRGGFDEKSRNKEEVNKSAKYPECFVYKGM
jgi:hypothetical protein